LHSEEYGKGRWNTNKEALKYCFVAGERTCITQN
jgi:hypothetical protein